MRLRRRDNQTLLSESSRPQSEEPAPQRDDRRRSGATRSRRKNNSKTKAQSSAPNPASSPLPSSSAAPASRLLAAEDTSPDSKCPICLDRFNNLAYLDRCLHRFCFMCIQEWSHNKAECPLCKQPFTSILHSVRGHNDFKKYTLRPRPDMDSVEATIAMVAAMAGDERVRLTLRRDRDESDGRRHRRNRRNVPLLEWIVHAPPGTLLNQPLGQDQTGPLDLTERGIVFEGLTGLGAAGNMPPFVGNNRETRRLLAKLAARQRLQREGESVRPLRDRDMVALRRGLYRCGIRVRGVARGNDEQPQRPVSAESFCQNPSLLGRLRPWLRRELTVLYGAHDPLISIVVRLILNALARLGLEDLAPAADELRPFLLARTEQFMYELACFARSPLNMESYDLHAVYEPPEVAFNYERIDSSDSSVIIAISEDEERERGARVQPENPPTSLSGWDDETPGPSYTTVDPSCFLSGLSPAPHDSSNQIRAPPSRPLSPLSPRQLRHDEDEAEEECLIVGYKKPIAERTPELVQLSSDSDEEKDKKKKRDGGEEEEKKKDRQTEEGEKGASEGKEDADVKDKQTETLLPTVSPKTPCAQELAVASVRPSRSSSVLSPVVSSAVVSSTVVSSAVVSSAVVSSGDSPQTRPRRPHGESRRRRRERRRNRRLRSSSSLLLLPAAPRAPPLSASSSRRFSPSPDESSVASDSDWAPGCSLSVSPLGSSSTSTHITSPSSSPSSSCSSLFGSSPSALALTPPPRDSDTITTAAAEKPGGKRKYKSRHLDCDVGDPTWRPGGGRHGNARSKSKAKEMERARREEREKRRRRRRRERQRRESGESRCREERSPSVEIVFEGTVSPAPKRRRRRQQRHSLLSSSPLVITLDSDSGRDLDLDRSSSACSSPFGSQQTVDFCHFPALPLVHSSGVGGTLAGGDIGELPVDILDRDSEKSERSERANYRDAPTDLISLENTSDDSTDIDVERVKTPNPGTEEFSKDSKQLQHLENNKNKPSSSSFRPEFQETEGFSNVANQDAEDRQLLNSILSVLDGIATKSDLPSTSSPSFPQNNHFKNCSFPDKPKSIVVDSFQSTFHPFSLPSFLKLTENRKKSPQNASTSAENAETSDESRTLHDLDVHREIADSLLALRDPESSLTSTGSGQTQSTNSRTNRASTGQNSRSTPDSDSFLADLNARTADLLSDLAPRKDGDGKGEFEEHQNDLKHADLGLDVRNCAQTNAEDVK